MRNAHTTPHAHPFKFAKYSKISNPLFLIFQKNLFHILTAYKITMCAIMPMFLVEKIDQVFCEHLQLERQSNIFDL